MIVLNYTAAFCLTIVNVAWVHFNELAHFSYMFVIPLYSQNPHFYHCARKIPHFSVSSSHPPAVPAFFPRTVPSSGSFGISTQNHFLLGYNTPYNGNVFYFSSFLLALFDEENSVGYIKYWTILLSVFLLSNSVYHRNLLKFTRILTGFKFWKQNSDTI